METVPFTYHICWTKENLHYYGMKTAEGCKPSDLWTNYFTSSNPVKELRRTIGEPDVVEVRKTFEKTRDWESKVLRRLKVTQRDDWVNECCFPCYNWTGRKHSEETKVKISKSKIGVKNPKLSERMRGKNNPNFEKTGFMLGKKHSEETKKKMSESTKGVNNPQYGKKGKDSTCFGKILSEEHKKKISDAQKGEKNHNFGKKASKETRLKISESHKGEKHHNFGKHLSDEYKKKISNSLKEYYKTKNQNN